MVSGGQDQGNFSLTKVGNTNGPGVGKTRDPRQAGKYIRHLLI